MGPTREEVLKAERCDGFARHYDSDDIDEMFVVPDGPYEQPIYWYFVRSNSWDFKSPDSFWSYYDSELMMMHIRGFTNEEALQFLEERHAFDEEKEK